MFLFVFLPVLNNLPIHGLPAEYIIGIMGEETRWGRILGKHRVIDALVTSAITNQRRSDFFFKELKN